MIHDCAITTNFIILFMWPFEVDREGMKKGGQHWKWSAGRKVTFQVIPRRADNVPEG
jgi:carotenoid cleavage dioxygenase